MSKRTGKQVVSAFNKAYRTDDESALKKGDRLKRTLENASDENKELIDDIFITLCGYSLTTLVSED